MQPNKINVANPEAISYTTEELGFTVLGLRLDGLDRMRVTVKIEVITSIGAGLYSGAGMRRR